MAKKHIENKNKSLLLIIIYLVFLTFIIIFLKESYNNNHKELLSNKDISNTKIEEKDETKVENKENELENDKKDETKKTEDEKKLFECPKPDKDYEDFSLLNIGQSTSLPELKYIPKNLKEINSKYSTKSGLCLIEEINESFAQMAEDAKLSKINIKASSAFRNYNYQKILFDNSVKDENGVSMSTAKPGYSEHQLGTTIDITGSSINYLSASDLFDNTKEDLWLKDNSYLYGFIQSYPYGKEEITGYKYEPWHYRYIGKEKAAELKKLDLTLKEYLAK